MLENRTHNAAALDHKDGAFHVIFETTEGEAYCRIDAGEHIACYAESIELAHVCRKFMDKQARESVAAFKIERW